MRRTLLFKQALLTKISRISAASQTLRMSSLYYNSYKREIKMVAKWVVELTDCSNELKVEIATRAVDFMDLSLSVHYPGPFHPRLHPAGLPTRFFTYFSYHKHYANSHPPSTNPSARSAWESPDSQTLSNRNHIQSLVLILQQHGYR